MLRAPSAGKLTQYMAEDGGHVEAGGSYAEMEVSTDQVLGLGQASAAPSPSPLPEGGPSVRHCFCKRSSPLTWATGCKFLREPVGGVWPRFPAVFKGKNLQKAHLPGNG